MRISDWSSDVCSSDLVVARVDAPQPAAASRLLELVQAAQGGLHLVGADSHVLPGLLRLPGLQRALGVGDALALGEYFLREPVDLRPVGLGPGRGAEIGRASCRERAWQYV